MVQSVLVNEHVICVQQSACTQYRSGKVKIPNLRLPCSNSNNTVCPAEYIRNCTQTFRKYEWILSQLGQDRFPTQPSHFIIPVSFHSSIYRSCCFIGRKKSAVYNWQGTCADLIAPDLPMFRSRKIYWIIFEGEKNCVSRGRKLNK